ncbi:MAG: hypothetical protein CML16_03155 [Pusillimonas sp.]|nr:hypothetical protein [Pusillimonas sp.]MBC43585.1 hypothetical protein [Pusillimonas sp.]HCP78968.1 hypothetical protein [Pusillimonas sp.]
MQLFWYATEIKHHFAVTNASMRKKPFYLEHVEAFLSAKLSGFLGRGNHEFLIVDRIAFS